ncbi:MAG: hypothetical protein JO186_13055 [Actinobacteria bacterium]|nr:hypothetical protein [Actinomycetota bacterium]
MSTIPALDFLITAGSPGDIAPGEPHETLAAEPPRERGLVLKELTLAADHGLRAHIPFLDHAKEIYWLVTSFDLSRHPVFVFPLKAADAQPIAMEPGETFRWTLGAGAPLAPLRAITGGIAVMVYVASSHGGARAIGEHLTDAAAAVKSDRSLAAAIEKVVTHPGATAADAVSEVALEIPKIVGAVLAKAHDEVVGLFQGYFPAAADWSGMLTQQEAGATLVLGELP